MMDLTDTKRPSEKALDAAAQYLRIKPGDPLFMVGESMRSLASLLDAFAAAEIARVAALTWDEAVATEREAIHALIMQYADDGLPLGELLARIRARGKP